MSKKLLLSTALAAIVASAVIGVGAHYALAAEPQAVNASPAVAPAAPASFADIVQRVAPAVVSVDVEEGAAAAPAMDRQAPEPPFGEEDGPFGDLPQRFGEGAPPAQPLHAAGSGFFISDDGYIVTNNHVVENASKVTIKTADGKELPAHIIGRDPATDLAVLRVEGRGFPFVSFEDRAKPRVGDWVVAVGNPFNLGGTATAGIVSALNRANVSGSSYVDYMQIDAPINRGNSGGPSFDLSGRVVGVNSAIFSPSGGSVGIGFDIPADVAAAVSRQLIANGKVTRGYVGAAVQDVTPDIAASLGIPTQKGALVAEVVNGGPSARAGLQPGDVVEAVNGRSVASASDLTRAVALARPGEDVRLAVVRDGRHLTLDVRSGLRPSEQQLAENDLGAAGAGQADTRGGLGLMVTPHAGGGLEIERVDPASDAADKGLQAGDVIREVGGHSVNLASEMIGQVKAARTAGRHEVLLLVSRNGRDAFVPLHLQSQASGG
jgi:serine protease Do